jgi:two-component system, LytTR family, sensor kinase
MKKSVVVLLHLGYWGIYLLLLSVIFALTQVSLKRSIAFPGELFLSPVGISCIVPNLLSFYVFYLLLFPRFLSRRKFTLLVASGAAASLACAVVCGLLLGVLFGFDQAIFTSVTEFSGLLVPLSLVALAHGTIALILKGFITWYEEIKVKEELQIKNREMESALIRSKLDPHFLFNTINNIDVLIEKDAVKASAYLNKLSEIMRFVLYETRSEKIPLEKELGYIEKYIDLQKIRTSNESYVSFSVEGKSSGIDIEPMLFIPFIENAFKHAGNKKTANAIDVRFFLDRDTIKFECRNNIADNSVSTDFGGLGDGLIKKRLDLLYPGKHSLETGRTDVDYRVDLTINIK